MNEKKWTEFFELMQEIVDLPYSTWKEKKTAVLKASARFDGETPLDEFIGWFEGTIEN